MPNLLRVLRVLVVTGLGAYVFGGAPRSAQAASPPLNACGCYRDSNGACFCGKKTKCDCAGECEPKGCEEKRAKEIEREVELETRRARDGEKKQRDEEAERLRKEAAAQRAAEEGESISDTSAEGNADDAAGDDAAKNEKAKSIKTAKASKASKKNHSAKPGAQASSKD